MKINESKFDRIIRVLIGVALVALNLLQVVSGPLGVVSLVLGAILLITGVVGFCPLYALLKIRDRKSVV